MLVLVTTEIGSDVGGVASGISVATTCGVDVGGGDVAGGDVATTGVGVLSTDVEHAPTANNIADADAPNSNQTNKRLIPKLIFIVSFHLS